MLRLDHVIIAVQDLTRAVESYRSLGFTVIPGGIHRSNATWNALIPFKDGSYLELMAPTRKPPEAGTDDYSFLVREGEGIVGFAMYSEDLDTDVDAMRGRGISLSFIRSGGRRQDGIDMRWRVASPVFGFSPFLLQDMTPRHLRIPSDEASTTHANTVTGIAALYLGMEHENISNAITYYTMFTGVPAVTDFQVYSYIRLEGLTINFRPPLSKRRLPDAFGDVPEEIVLNTTDYEVEPHLFDMAYTHGVRFSLSKP